MKFFKSFSIYTLSSFIDKGLAFLLLPIFTYYLTPADYGILSLITTLAAFLAPFITLGTTGAISASYFRLEKKDYPAYFSSAIIPSLCASILLFVIFIAGLGQFISINLGVPLFWLLLIPLLCFCDFFRSVSLTNFQVKNQPLKYSGVSLSYSILNICISLLLVAIYNQGYSGRLIGQYSTSFVILVFLLFYLRKSGLLTKMIKKEYIKDCLSFGLPLIPHLIGVIIINMSDRIFIDKLIGKEALGIYNVGYTIGGLIMIINMAFANTIVPYSFERFTQNTQKSKEEVIKMYWLFIIILIIITLLMFLALPFIFDLFINKRYAEGQKYVYWIASAYVFNGIYLLFANIIFYLKKTKVLFYLSFFNVLINLSLNYFLISTFGTIGAAYATFLTFFLFTTIIIFVTCRLYKLPWLYFLK